MTIRQAGVLVVVLAGVLLVLPCVLVVRGGVAAWALYDSHGDAAPAERPGDTVPVPAASAGQKAPGPAPRGKPGR
jgi:hypothetical protein